MMNMNLRALAFILCFTILSSSSQGQSGSSSVTSIPTYKRVQSRARDHFIVQFGYLNWANKPDSVRLNSFNRQFKFAAMYDILIKGLPNLSVAIGGGFAWDNVYFNNAKLDISQNAYNTAQLGDRNNQEHFEKDKITTFYAEFPAEFRFAGNYKNYNKGFKLALGLTYGYLLQAKTKGVNLLNASGASINNSKIVNIDSRYFNSSRFLVHARIGWGFFHVYGSYQLDALFTPQGGPNVSPYSFGIGLNGL